MTQYVLIAADGYGCHLESGFKYTTPAGGRSIRTMPSPKRMSRDAGHHV